MWDISAGFGRRVGGGGRLELSEAFLFGDERVGEDFDGELRFTPVLKVGWGETTFEEIAWW